MLSRINFNVLNSNFWFCLGAFRLYDFGFNVAVFIFILLHNGAWKVFFSLYSQLVNSHRLGTLLWHSTESGRKRDEMGNIILRRSLLTKILRHKSKKIFIHHCFYGLRSRSVSPHCLSNGWHDFPLHRCFDPIFRDFAHKFRWCET